MTSKFQPHKTWIILGVALSIGLLAALGAHSYLNTQMAAMEARAKGQTINLIVAKSDLRKGSKLSSDNVAVRPIPLDYSHSTALSPAEFDRIDGQTLAYDVKSGEMILWGLLEGKRTPTFSARVEAGHRAITVPVDEINSISGMLEPGDIIDLIITVDQQGKKITFPLLQSVPVLATGQQSASHSQDGERRQYATITLDTTPEQAQNVIVAREAGKITALLRNPQDKNPLGRASGDISALLGSKTKENLRGSTNPIPVLYGGRSNTLPTDALNLPSHHAAAETSESSPAMEALKAIVTAKP